MHLDDEDFGDYDDVLFQFFVNASNQFGEEFDELEADDLDLEFMSFTMKETFESTGTLADKLGEINHDLVQLLVQLEQKKTAKSVLRYFIIFVLGEIIFNFLGLAMTISWTPILSPYT